jgi:hypothetical protein
MLDDVRGSGVVSRRVRGWRAGAWRRVLALVLLSSCVGGCTRIRESIGGSVRPRALRDVPAVRLAFRFEPDIDTSNLPASFTTDETEEPHAPVKADFDERRKEEALLRTVLSPDGQRALALYATSETAEGDFRMDLYMSSGQFVRNILPPELIGTFPQWVSWSADGQQIAFVGIKNAAPTPTPTPLDELFPAPAPAGGPNEGEATPAPSVAPIIAPVPVFSTEQIYVCDRDGLQIRPLTSRDGLIYFSPAWSPDSHAIAALACKPDEWDARRREDKTAAGRPRLIDLEGRERLLSDRLADSALVWSPDASKVAAAFDTDIAIYDAAGQSPTGADIPLRDALLAASAKYDADQRSKKNAAAQSSDNKTPPANAPNTSPQATTTDAPPLSFNPIVRLEWLQPEMLLVRTAFVRLYKNGELITNYPRWHILHLSPQAAVLSLKRQTPARTDKLPAPSRARTERRGPRASDFSRASVANLKSSLKGARTS